MKITLALLCILTANIGLGQTPTPTPKNEVEDPSTLIQATSKVIWEEPKDGLPTTQPPTNWKIDTFRDKQYKHIHTMKDGTIIRIDVVPFMLTPANPKMIYFLEPGYSPETGLNHNLGVSITNQNKHIDKSVDDMKAIAEQLEKLREYLIN